MRAIKEELAGRLKNLRAADGSMKLGACRKERFFDLEMMETMGFCKGIENYSRHLSGRSQGEPPPTLFDYLPADSLLFIDESHVTVPQLGGMYRGDRSRKETLVEYGFRLPSALDNRPLQFEEFLHLSPPTILFRRRRLTTSAKKRQIVEQLVRPTGLIDPQVIVRPATTQVDDLCGEITERVKKKERVLTTTLTKRMAEKLTEFLTESGIRARYLHADIDTVERVEILRDLRLGVFDVLVGINLLREGLDLPEVSLVAVFDADKEGFFAFRAIFNSNHGTGGASYQRDGHFIRDKITKSMRRAMDETDRRRNIQLAHNKANNISPRGVQKAVKSLIEVGEAVSEDAPNKTRDWRRMSETQLGRELRRLEKEMHAHAHNLEFEKAAEARDQIRIIKRQILGVDV